MNTDLQHWKVEELAEGIRHLQLDRQGVSVNTLGLEVLQELDGLIQSLEANPPHALIISSAKQAGFLAGADVNEFLELESKAQVLERLQWVQGLFLRLERLPSISIAVIHGHCLGGGLELALACKYRVADRAPETQIGLPEVKLGIHPGYGGAVRLSRLIDPMQALNLMLAGKMVDGRTAARLGIVHRATQKRHLMTAALAIAEGRDKPRVRRSFNARLFGLKPARALAGNLARRQVAKKASEEHYPSLYRLIDLWVNLPAGDEDAYRAEAESVAGLFDHPQGARTVHNLVRLFLLDREYRGRAKKHGFEGNRIHVVGAGVMGGDIAAWCALRGFEVTLQDARADLIGPAMKRAHQLFERKLKVRHLVTSAMDRLVADPQGSGVEHADLIIEAISERLEAKRGLYAQLEPRMKTGALLATNTSSLPLEQLSEQLQKPERLVGIHFFNPVALMQLVEVVRGKQTGDHSFEQALGFVSRIGKLPIAVVSSPGFLVNRVLMAYLGEALQMLEEGVPGPLIDKLALKLGFPMGPIELADTVGLDICQAVARELIANLGGTESTLLNQKVEAGKLGKKTGQGFYKWSGGKAAKPAYQSSGHDLDLLHDRLLYRLLNESVDCLSEGVVGSGEELDLGMVFGTGYPPFLGGPMRTIEESGAEACRQRLEQLAQKVGERFQPGRGWQQLNFDDGAGQSVSS